MKVEAQLRVRLEGIVKVSSRYGTLFNGLRRNHPHKAAIVYPVTFLMRRLFYSIVIIFMAQLPVVGAFLLSIVCIFMIAFVVVEKQWEDSLIARQHVFNEVALYVVLLGATVCALPIAPGALALIGWFLVSTVLITVVVNLVVIAYYMANHLLRVKKRGLCRHARRKSRSLVHSSSSVKKQTKNVSVLKDTLASVEDDENPTTGKKLIRNRSEICISARHSYIDPNTRDLRSSMSNHPVSNDLLNLNTVPIPLRSIKSQKMTIDEESAVVTQENKSVLERNDKNVLYTKSPSGNQQYEVSYNRSAASMEDVKDSDDGDDELSGEIADE